MGSHLIRFANPEDADAILEIYSPFVSDTSISFEIEVPTRHEVEQRIVETGSSFPWLVYEVDHKILGYSYASPHRSRRAYSWCVESSVYVANGCQGRGIGKQLYSQLFKSLKLQGVVNVFAGITQPNEPSVRLHESFGFRLIGLFKDAGFKLDQWWDVGWWQLQLQRPERPVEVLGPPQIA